MAISSKLADRLIEIEAMPYSDEWKAEQKRLAIRSAETIESVGNRLPFTKESKGEYPSPRPYDDHETRIKWEQATDHS